MSNSMILPYPSYGFDLVLLHIDQDSTDFLSLDSSRQDQKILGIAPSPESKSPTCSRGRLGTQSSIGVWLPGARG